MAEEPRIAVPATGEPACCGTTRRDVLRATAAAAVTGIAVAGLAACSAPASGPAETAAGAEGAAGAGEAPIVADPVTVGPVADIPVGGGKVFADQKMVVTQPQQGEFKVFDAQCPHQGCLVSGVERGAIVCRCHGSRFDIADGAPMSGPARSPLQALATPKVENGQLVLG